MKPNTTQQISVARVQQFIRSRFNPIRLADPDLLSQYLDQFKVGFLRQPTLLWDAIVERDDLLSCVVQKRFKSVARNAWEICMVETDDTTEAERHQETLNEFWNNVTVTDAIDENDQGEVSLLVRQMMTAQAHRYAVHEIVWQPGSVFTAQFRKAPVWFFENTTGRLRYIATENAIYGQEMDPAAWSVAVGDGLMAACSVAWMYKNLSLKDWVIYNERHGMPGIHGKTSAAQGSTEWEALVEAVGNFGTDWSIVTNEGATIEKIDLATQGQLPYPPLVERMDRAMAAIWRGADLGTISSGKGDGTGASLQGEETAVLEEDDCRWISETLRRNVDRLVIEYVYGKGVKPLAYFNLKPKTRQDVERELRVDETLHRMGLPVSQAALAERYARPLPEADDAILPAPAGAATVIAPNAEQPGTAAGNLSAQISQAVTETLDTRAALLKPWLDSLATLEQAGLSDADFLAEVERRIAALSDLLTPDAVAALSEPLQRAMAAGIKPEAVPT